MTEKEYILFCDESDRRGKYYSNFYGGVMVGASQYQRITRRLNEMKTDLNLYGEVKWQRVSIRHDDITEVRSHEHVLLQCLDIVLGSMAFRLNDKHKAKPPGAHRRGKRTVAKEKLYKAILAEIRNIRPGFNIGVSTRVETFSQRWSAPYLHWNFIPSNSEFNNRLTKKGQRATTIKKPH